MIKISTDYSIVTVEQIIKDKQPFDKLVFHVKKLSNGRYSYLDSRKWCSFNGLDYNLNSSDFYSNKGS